MSMMHIEAKIRHTADYNKLWESIPHEGVGVGAKGSDYLLTFNGDCEVGKKIIEGILAEGHAEARFTCGY